MNCMYSAPGIILSSWMQVKINKQIRKQKRKKENSTQEFPGGSVDLGLSALAVMALGSIHSWEPRILQATE